MHYLKMHNDMRPKPDFTSCEKVAIDLICKGALFMGAGVGLYIALRVFTGVNPP